MNLRFARSADAERIARLHAESWRVAYRGMYHDEYLDGPVFEDRLSVWQKRFDEPVDNEYLLLAEDGEDEVAGFVYALGNEDAHWGTLIDNLHVLPHRQRQGLGRTLLAASAAWSNERYPDALLYLWVLESNANARRFYELLGAQPQESAVSEPPGGGSITALRYVWPSVEGLLPFAP